MAYSDLYYKRHFDRYRVWENKVGEYLYDFLKPESVLDLGCGVGSYLEGFFNAGCRDLVGIEINYEMAKPYIIDSILPFIKGGDITQDLDINRKFDCVMSIEVGEHINPSGTQMLVNNLSSHSCGHIVFTAAPPGQRGTNHINLMRKEIWIDLLTRNGFHYRQDYVDKFVKDWKKIGVERYILSNLMVFYIDNKD